MKNRAAILALLISCKLYSEDVPVTLKVKNYERPFFMTMQEEGRIFFNLSDFISSIQGKSYMTEDLITIRVNNSDDFFIDINNKKVKFRDRSQNFHEDSLRRIDNDIYIDSQLLEVLGDIEYDSSRLLLSLHPDFQLKYEYDEDIAHNRNRLEMERLREKENSSFKGLQVEVPNKAFSLGRLKINYENRDIGRGFNDDTLSVDLNNRLFYGEFNTSVDLNDSTDWDYWNLTYDSNVMKFLGDKELVFGDSYSQNDDLPNNELRGVAIRSNTFTASYGKTDITGYTSNGNIVELYINNRLYDYLIVKNGRYIFKDIDVSSDTDLKVRIYDENNNYTEEIITVKSFADIQERGGWDYQFNYGENRSIDENQLDFNFLYGFTSNLTIGAGYHQVADRRIPRSENEFVDLTAIYRLPLRISPVTVKTTVYNNTTTSDNNYITELKTELLGHDITLEYEEYDYLIDDYYRKVDIRANNRIGSYSYRVDSERKYYDLYYEDTYGLTLTKYLERSYIEIDNEYTRYSNRDKREFDLDIKYSKAFDKLTTIIESHHNWTEGQDRDDEIEIRVQNYSSSSPIEYSIFANYDMDRDYEIGVELSYDLYSGITGLFNLINNDDNNDDFTAGIRIEKTIVLEKPLKDTKSEDVDDSWIYGRFYRDVNSNGIYDKGDTPVRGKIMVENEVYDIDPQGNYFIGNIDPENYTEINLGRFKAHPVWRTEHEKIRVKGISGTGIHLDIPVKKVISIAGTVTTNDQSLMEDTYIQVMKDGTLVKEHKVDPDGFYLIEEIPAHNYKLKVVYKGDSFFQVIRESSDIDPSYTSFFNGVDFELKGAETDDEKIDYNVVINSK